MRAGSEYEFISHNRIHHLNAFIVELHSRNPHVHRDFELCLVLGGEVYVYSNRENYRFRRDDLFLFNPLQPHELRAVGDRVLILSVQASLAFCSGFFPDINRLQFERTDLSGALDEDRLETLRMTLLDLAAAYFDQSYGHEFLCFSLLNRLFHKLLLAVPHRLISEARQTREMARFHRLRRILQHIDENYADKLLLRAIAEKENLSLSYLSHFFRDNLNIPFQDYLNEIRFEKALQLVARTDKPLIDICMETGFSDTRYLNKMFMKRLGATPAEYRKSRKAEPGAYAAGEPAYGNVQTFLADEESLAFLRSYSRNRHHAG